ncbi:MAG: TetR/AcrR family transcriptional regulator [Alphaproteobacteria bacterium]|jgi:AcrR family transcriptional regulator
MTAAQVQLSPRAVRTRSALLAAGYELLAERPIDAIAIDDIVARAGVAKGSFFNHFTDKAGFAAELGAAVRAELELLVGAANAKVSDPVERLAGGMRVALDFALTQRKRCIVMLRGLELSTGIDHHLNQGIRADIAAIAEAGLARPEAVRSGVRFWLGLCQIMQLNAIERALTRRDAAERLREMLVLGLTGLGVPEGRAMAAAEQVSAAF